MNLMKEKETNDHDDLFIDVLFVFKLYLMFFILIFLIYLLYF